MSQLDDTILDALTHVTFPKGFAQAEPAWVVPKSWPMNKM